jgi:hypothetical protein
VNSLQDNLSSTTTLSVRLFLVKGKLPVLKRQMLRPDFAPCDFFMNGNYKL